MRCPRCGAGMEQISVIKTDYDPMTGERYERDVGGEYECPDCDKVVY